MAHADFFTARATVDSSHTLARTSSICPSRPSRSSQDARSGVAHRHADAGALGGRAFDDLAAKEPRSAEHGDAFGCHRALLLNGMSMQGIAILRIRTIPMAAQSGYDQHEFGGDLRSVKPMESDE